MVTKEGELIPIDAPPPYASTPLRTPSKPTPPARRPPFPIEIPTIQRLQTQRVILASASPRRKTLLASLGLTNLEVIPSTFPEDIPKANLSPYEYVSQTAEAKARAVYERALNDPRRGDPALLIAADTVVVSAEGVLLEKPRSEEEHLRMLRRLRGVMPAAGAEGLEGLVPHRVYTAVCVMAPNESARAPGYRIENVVEETKVFFDPAVGDEMLGAYVRTREGVDKAGGYGIQGVGMVWVKGIEGSWDNVVGLPLRTTLGLIEKVLDQGRDGDLLDAEIVDLEGEGEEEEDD